MGVSRPKQQGVAAAALGRSGQFVHTGRGALAPGPVSENGSLDPFQIESARLIMPRALAGRIVNQRGLFSVHAHPDRYWGVHAKDINIERFDIPAGMKEWLL